ncbi:hypothetical protein H5J22_03875 [Cetobacterium sp. 8H]|uniref:ankyrin repeat domain-containing protein n=1 Tax=Cetobacterium sp. 8H TaxID=2759681 RepID=UPI00163C0421|nr:hypothetical protein [Cetobacterium sp. 8H]MBC2850581.1 hypothetical protein [Cetobacterium sp. 8H]
MKRLLISIIVLLTLLGCSNGDKRVYTEDEIIAAVVVDNVYILNRAIKNGFNIDQQLKNGDTLLSLALKEDSLQVISSLLANGADINKDLPSKKVIGTNITLPSRPPIFYVNSIEALNLFINEKANLNQVGGDGELLLNFYIKTRPADLAISLIKNGASLNILDMSEWYPIFWAVNIENEKIIKEMLSRDRKQYLLKDKKLNYPIYYANSREVMKILLEGEYNPKETNIYGENILGEVYLKAKKLGYSDILRTLVDKGVNPNYISYK